MSKYDNGIRLINSLLKAFAGAYHTHAGGLSKDAMMIHHDICAAASDMNPEIIAAHRAAILSAIDAVDKNVPLARARVDLRNHLIEQLDELNETGT